MKRIQLFALLVVVLIASTLLGTQADNAAAQAPVVDLNMTPGQAYLGPEVVISGTASGAGPVSSVLAVVQNTDTGEYVQQDGTLGVTPVGIPAWTALMPPPADGAVTFRVPMASLVDGNYSVRVTATSGGASITPPATPFEVVSAAIAPTDLVPQNAVWSYFDLGTEPPPSSTAPPLAWIELGYDDALWASGPAELGYGDGDETTLISATDPGGAQLRTAYFRHEFNVADPTAYTSIEMASLRDDGAVYYLNGNEIGRSNMSNGNITYNTWASSTSEQIITATLDPADFVAGANVISAEVHQVNANSSDISFWLTLEGVAQSTPLVSDATEGTYVLTAGDMANCGYDGDEQVAMQMDELWDTDAGVFIGLGDLAYGSGTFAEFSNCFDPTIGRHKDVIWPSAGNHEHYTMPQAAGYRQYFGDAAGPESQTAADQKLWYSFDIDEYWHVIALDSDCRGREVLTGAIGNDGCAVGSEQEQWLRADLAANADKNILAFFHHPPYTNNRYEDHEYTWPLWRALAEYGADITLHGHEHHYERYAQIDYWGDRDPVHGARQFIIGSGGTGPRYNEKPQQPESDYKGTFPNGSFDFGVLQLWLRPDGYEWKWESIFGLAAPDAGTSGLTEPMPMGIFDGTVTDTVTALPVGNVEVCVTADRTGLEACTITAADGTWAIGPLVSDRYDFVYTPLDPGHLGEAVVWNMAGNDRTVDQELDPLVTIEGTVTVASTSSPGAGAIVCATDIATGQEVNCGTSAADGTYVIEDLPLGTYEVEFALGGTQTECWLDDVGCQAPSPVDLTLGAVTGIDADLEGLLGDVDCDGRVTLLDGRNAAQYAIGVRSLVQSCPLGDVLTETYEPAGDMDGDGSISLLDARHIARCAIGVAGPGCPNPL